MKTLLRMVVFLLTIMGVRADELVFSLLIEAGPHQAGSSVWVEVAGMNPSNRESPFRLAQTLAAKLKISAREVPVVLEAAGASPVAVPPGGFGVRRFRLTLPPEIHGEAVLTVTPDDATSLRAVLDIVAPGDPLQASSQAAKESVLDRLASSAPASSGLARNFSGRFLPNQPIYFIYGDADQAAKFQFSFDYRLATVAMGDDHSTGTLRVGYTQRSVWDIKGDSSPFYDTSYLPEIAFNHDSAMPRQLSQWFTWLGWRAGFLHESNGKEALDSRSINTFYVRPRFVLGTLGQWAFVMLPELQGYIGKSGENPDIKDYRGYGKLRFYFGHNQGASISVSAWAGKEFEHGTYQLDLAIPAQVQWVKLESYFYLQYFNGYGESLLGYNRKSEALRVGVALIR